MTALTAISWMAIHFYVVLAGSALLYAWDNNRLIQAVRTHQDPLFIREMFW